MTKIDFTIADRATNLLHYYTGSPITRNHMYHILVDKGIIYKDGTATEYSIKNGLIN